MKRRHEEARKGRRFRRIQAYDCPLCHTRLRRLRWVEKVGPDGEGELEHAMLSCPEAGCSYLAEEALSERYWNGGFDGPRSREVV